MVAGTAYETMGDVYLTLGKHEEAIESLESSIRMLRGIRDA